MDRRNPLFLIPILLMSCRIFTPTATSTPLSTPTSFPVQPTPTATVTAQASLEPSPYEVRIHPEEGLYVGDLVSFEVISLAETHIDENTYVEIELQLPAQVTLGQEYFGPFGIGDRQQATFSWIWDTTGLEPGEYEFAFRVQPNGPEWEKA